MLIKYTFSGRSNQFDTSDSEDLATLCSEVENHIRAEHPQLAGEKYLTERVADALLNGLSGDDQEVDLGNLSPVS